MFQVVILLDSTKRSKHFVQYIMYLDILFLHYFNFMADLNLVPRLAAKKAKQIN